MSAIDDIRRAAFEVRQTDPQEAVRILRRAAAEGGEAEVLARGALGEIYLEEFGDLDGAESEFRKVLQAAPGLAAAEIGLARTRREAGDFAEADAGFSRAIESLSRDVETFEKEPPPGAEEVVLTLLEVAVELAELRGASGHDKAVAVPLDEDLLQWAAGQKLFDAEEDRDDWIRFHALWTQLRLLTGRAEEALAAVREAERQGQLPPPEAARLLSLALEDLDDRPRAGAEAKRMLELLPAPWPVGEVVRAAHLLGDNDLLEQGLAQWPPESDEGQGAPRIPRPFTGSEIGHPSEIGDTLGGHSPMSVPEMGVPDSAALFADPELEGEQGPGLARVAAGQQRVPQDVVDRSRVQERPMRADGDATRSCSSGRSGPRSHTPTGGGACAGAVSTSRGSRSATASRSRRAPWARPSLCRAAGGTTSAASAGSRNGACTSTPARCAAACSPASTPSGSATSMSNATAASALPTTSTLAPSATRACDPSSACRSSSENTSTSARARAAPLVPIADAARCSRPRCGRGAIADIRFAARAARPECGSRAARR